MTLKSPSKQLLMGLCILLPAAAQCEQFSIAVIPDTQIYVEENPEIFEAQMQWIVDNQISENIIYVSHLGDLKDDQSCDNKIINNGTGGGRDEWTIVDDTLATLEAASIPYGVVPGNHDFDQVGSSCPNFTTERPLSTYNTIVGPLRFAGQPYYGDPSVPTAGNRVVGSNEDNFTLFGSCGVNFIAINLAYKQAANAMGMDAEITWADNLLKAYPDRMGIITSHYFLDDNPGNSFGAYGQEVYDGLSNNPNLLMMLSAHERGEAWRVETTGRGGMQPVQVLLSDYQSAGYPPVDYSNVPYCGSSCGDSGFMRIMRFDTDTGILDIETFIPPVPFLGRMSTLVSDYFPVDGTGMDRDTASNLSFSFEGYVTNDECTGPVVTGPVVVEDSAERFELTFSNDDSFSGFPVGAVGGREVTITSGGESASIAISLAFRDSIGNLEDHIFVFQSISTDPIFPDPNNEPGDVLVYSLANGFAGVDGGVFGDGLMPGFVNTVLTVVVGPTREDAFTATLVLSNP